MLFRSQRNTASGQLDYVWTLDGPRELQVEVGAVGTLRVMLQARAGGDDDRTPAPLVGSQSVVSLPLGDEANEGLTFYEVTADDRRAPVGGGSQVLGTEAGNAVLGDSVMLTTVELSSRGGETVGGWAAALIVRSRDGRVFRVSMARPNAPAIDMNVEGGQSVEQAAVVFSDDSDDEIDLP